jgi:hypothetical protein
MDLEAIEAQCLVGAMGWHGGVSPCGARARRPGHRPPSGASQGSIIRRLRRFEKA